MVVMANTCTLHTINVGNFISGYILGVELSNWLVPRLAGIRPSILNLLQTAIQHFHEAV